MIIVEGPDNSGKSTLCEYLSKELDLPIKHSHSPPKDEQEFHDRVMFMFDNPHNYIFDRIPLISEQVYSILRDKNFVHMVYQNLSVYGHLRSLNPIVIYCRPPDEIVLHGHEAKAGEDPEHIKALESMLLQVLKRYDTVMNSYEYMPISWTYDYTCDDKTELLWRIKREVKTRQFKKGERNATTNTRCLPVSNQNSTE